MVTKLIYQQEIHNINSLKKIEKNQIVIGEGRGNLFDKY